jgi:acyl dehydratase
MANDTNKKGFFDLTEALSLIGKAKPLTEHEAFLAKTPVDASELRRYALSVEDANPLWYDDEYAKTTRWKGIIAAPTFVHTCGGGTALFVHIPGTDDWPHGSLFAGSELKFYIPVRVGDRITPTSKLHKVVEKDGNFVGPIAFVTAETTFTNQNNQVVAVWYSTVAKYSTKNAQSKGTYMEEELGEMFPPGFPDMRKGETRARGKKPLYYEDVNVGDLVTPMVRKLTVPQIVATADAASRISYILPYTMPGPGCYWHYATGESWKIRGLPAPMDEGPIRMAQPSQLMTDWIGDDGWLESLRIEIRHPIFAGDTTTWQGKVTRKYVEGGKHLVECEIWADNQRKQVSTKGGATVSLPSRA